MERHRHRHHRNLLFFFVLLSFVPHLTTSAYNPATTHLINCGSGTVVIQDGRTFYGDSNSNALSSNASSVSVLDPKSQNGSTLYSTARVFTAETSYNLNINTSASHFLRLHFSPFTTTYYNLSAAARTPYNLSAAVFSVSASNSFLLLSRFSAAAKTSPLIKEYILWASSPGELVVTFSPWPGKFAFVNAIEVFTAPGSYITGLLDRQITQPGQLDFTGNLTFQAMETVVRVNAGGPPLTPSNDTLWRNWVNDEGFLFLKDAAKAVNTTNDLQYGFPSGIPTREFAPDAVYKTAETMNLSGTALVKKFNITWNFPVTAGYKYFLRLHFCNFVATSPDSLRFDVFVNNMTAVGDFDPETSTNGRLMVPFFKDFVINAETADMVRISIGPRSNNGNAFLNGAEIMKVNNSVGRLDDDVNPLPPNMQNSKHRKKNVIIAAAAAAGAVVLFFSLAALFLLVRKKRRAESATATTKSHESGTSVWTSIPGAGGGNSVSTVSRGSVIPASPHMNLGLLISLEELSFATNGFDESLVIGSGGFGKVYKGELRDGRAVAVKRGSSTSRQGYPEFQNEITVLSQIRHRHLVSLVGYCDENGQMILVYEYMEKGTLKSHLYGGDADAPCPSWNQRLRICIGAARGLHYLHTGYSPGIIHRDVKSSNILLGEDYLTKVADFGLSRLGPSVGETHVSTGVKGSFGYLDPEYFKTQKLTDKSDVYSFGVVLFEVLCARPVIDPLLDREQLNLAEWAMLWQRKGMLEEVVDPRLRGCINPNSLRKFGEAAEKCLAEYGVDRPSIGDVLWNLEYALQLQETELKREPFEDSVNSESHIPVAPAVAPPVVRHAVVPMNVSGEGSENTAVMTESNIFSQLVNTEGR